MRVQGVQGQGCPQHESAARTSTLQTSLRGVESLGVGGSRQGRGVQGVQVQGGPGVSRGGPAISRKGQAYPLSVPAVSHPPKASIFKHGMPPPNHTWLIDNTPARLRGVLNISGVGTEIIEHSQREVSWPTNKVAPPTHMLMTVMQSRTYDSSRGYLRQCPSNSA